MNVSGVGKMLTEISSGGVVIFGNAILLLRKYNGDWVLPKGRVEEGEELQDAALREVFEESGIRGEIITYIDKVHYKYNSLKEDEIVCKTVHWYLMKTNNMHCVPQKREGFIDAKFVHMDKAKSIVRYEDEKKIIYRVLDIIEGNN